MFEDLELNVICVCNNQITTDLNREYAFWQIVMLNIYAFQKVIMYVTKMRVQDGYLVLQME